MARKHWREKSTLAAESAELRQNSGRTVADLHMGRVRAAISSRAKALRRSLLGHAWRSAHRSERRSDVGHGAGGRN